MKTIFAGLILFLLSFSVSAQQTDLSALSKSEGGKRVLAYFAALNSGDDQKLRDFFAENVAAESLKQRPVEARMEFHKRFRNDFPALEIKKLSSVSDAEISVLAQSKSGNWVTISFALENQTQKIAGMGIEPTEAPNSSDKPKYNAPATKPELLATVEKFLNDKVSADEFSGVVFIAEKDKPIFSKAYGSANKEKNQPNKLDTKFNLGSINKIFTRIAIGQLVQQGKISFDDKLGKFLPDYPKKDAAEKVTVRHLITMKSGIGDFFGEKFDGSPKGNYRKTSDFIQLFANQPLAFEPGTNQQYSNGGYILLGAIIEKVSGKSYYDYGRENIFKVAGMTETDSFESDKMPTNSAEGYTKRNPKGELTNNLDTRPARGSAAGGGYSTAGDLLKFSLALQSGKLTIPDDDGQPQKEARLGIAGGADGINGILIVNGQTGYTIIVLSNYDPPSAERVGSQIRDWLKQVKQ